MINKIEIKSKLDEKYRPKFFTDIVGNSDIVQQLREMVKSKNIPHLCFTGSAGTGKTSAAHVIIRELFGNVIKHNVLEINASDDSKVEVIRGRVKDFASKGVGNSKIPFKVIILDECDELTPKSQAALRRMMEMYYMYCRFILICNYKWKIIDPILSRCTVFDFKQITPQEMIPRLSYICEQEDIKIKPDALVRLAEKSNGDMRTAINSYIERLRLLKKEITIEMLDAIKEKEKLAIGILRDGLNGEFMKSRDKFMMAIQHGMNSRLIINSIVDVAISNGYSDLMKGDICLACLDSEKMLIDGCTNELVIAGLIAKLQIIGEKY